MRKIVLASTLAGAIAGGMCFQLAVDLRGAHGPSPVAHAYSLRSTFVVCAINRPWRLTEV